MEPPNDDSLLDRIYEAAVLPEFWPDVLDRLANLAGGVGGLLLVANEKQLNGGIASSALDSLASEWIAGGWAQRSQRAPRMMAKRHAGFSTDLDIYTEAELESEPDYTHFFRPRGLGWGAGTFIALPGGETAIVTVERRFDRGPISRPEVARLDAARPHLARAALMSARLGLERARTITATLDAVGLPAALVRADGRVVASNPGLDALDGQVIATAGGGIAFAHPPAQSLLRNALAHLDGHDSTRSIPVPSLHQRPPLICHVLPARRAAHDVFTGAAALLIITPVTAPTMPNASLLQGLYDLTPAEARLAGALTGGDTLESLANSLGVSRETLRSHLKAVFGKTGTRRQAELVGLLRGIVTLI